MEGKKREDVKKYLTIFVVKESGSLYVVRQTVAADYNP